MGLFSKLVKRRQRPVAVPLGFEIQRLSTKAIWHTLCHWDCQKKFVKRRLCNSRCAIGIGDAENLERGYMAHAVPLVFVANLFVKSSNISVSAMSRLNLVTLRFSVGCRCAIGSVTKWCDFPPLMWLSSISQLHWVMWLSAAWCDLSPALVYMIWEARVYTVCIYDTMFVFYIDIDTDIFFVVPSRSGHDFYSSSLCKSFTDQKGFLGWLKSRHKPINRKHLIVTNPKTEGSSSSQGILPTFTILCTQNSNFFH